MLKNSINNFNLFLFFLFNKNQKKLVMKTLYKFFKIPNSIKPQKFIEDLMEKLSYKKNNYPHSKIIQWQQNDNDADQYTLRLEVNGRPFYNRLYRCSKKYNNIMRNIELGVHNISFIVPEACNEKFLICEIKPGCNYEKRVYQVKKTRNQDIYTIYKHLAEDEELKIEYVADAKSCFYVALAKAENPKMLEMVLKSMNLKYRASNSCMKISAQQVQDAREKIKKLQKSKSHQQSSATTTRKGKKGNIKTKNETANNKRKKIINSQQSIHQQLERNNSHFNQQQIQSIASAAAQQALAPFQALLNKADQANYEGFGVTGKQQCYMMVPFNVPDVRDCNRWMKNNNLMQHNILGPQMMLNSLHMPYASPFNINKT